MKKATALTAIFLTMCTLLLGCSNSPAVEQEMVIPPKAMQPEEKISPSLSPKKVVQPKKNTQAELTEKVEFTHPVTAVEADNGWIALFDGHSLFGWDVDEGCQWEVNQGMISCTTGPNGFLRSFVPFRDYELIVEFKAQPDTNSGVMIRSVSPPKDPITDCYEVNIASSHPQGFLTGSIVGREKSKSDVTLGEWMTMHIVAKGPHITVKVNEQLTLDWTAPANDIRPLGHICLQKKEGPISFRKVILKPLGGAEMFNGTDLSGWHVVDGSDAAEFKSVNGVINIKGGRGFLESDDVAGNFMLQFQAQTNAPNLNGGVFFRSQKGTLKAQSNGYEYQIHNGIKDANPLTPLDFGTGGIYRRIPARRIIAQDKTWFNCTLVADGSRMESWVNGYPVTAWTDERAPNPNPREGLRTEPGHFIIQAHDPTTNIEMKALKLDKWD
jgi:hypothetical protein